MSFLIALLLLLGPEPRPDAPLLVKRVDFDCLVGGLDRLPRNRRKIYVRINVCPSQVIGASLPLPEPLRAPAEPIDVLALDAGEIACIRTHRRRIQAIARPVGRHHYRIDLPRCRLPPW